jgi:pimeloyl-ACP methyl ester carboxylesterase
MKRVGQVLLVLVLVVVAGAVTFYERPLWVLQQQTHLHFLLARVQSNYVVTPEGEVHYYEAEPRIPGGGTPLVLVHGLGDRAEAWEPMLIELRRAGFHVYAPDLLGYGRSPKPADGDYSMATQAKFVEDFIHALGLQRPDIGGWSMGGWVTLKVALDHPEMVDRVVVYDSAGIRFNPDFGPDVFHPTDAAGLRRLSLLLEPSSPPLPAFISRDALRKFAGEQWVIDRSMASMLSGKDSVEGGLPTMQNPLLIVWGSDDKLLPLSVALQMQKLDPRADLDVIEGCGHLAPKLCSSRVAAGTVAFLHSVPPPIGETHTFSRK